MISVKLVSGMVLALSFSVLCPLLGWSDSGARTTEASDQQARSETAENRSGSTLLRSAGYSRTRRADVPQASDVEASVGIQTSQPGALQGSVGGSVQGRVGLGAGFSAELNLERDVRTSKMKPGIGAQWQFQGRAGEPLAMSVYAQFRSEGFTQPEGEIETFILGTYRVGRGELSFNAGAGSDVEGAEKDVEFKLAGGYYRSSNWLLGAENENRWGFGTRTGSLGVLHDHFAGPMSQYRVGRVLMTAAVGLSARFQQSISVQTGAQGSVGVTYAF